MGNYLAPNTVLNLHYINVINITAMQITQKEISSEFAVPSAQAVRQNISYLEPGSSSGCVGHVAAKPAPVAYVCPMTLNKLRIMVFLFLYITIFFSYFELLGTDLPKDTV